MTSSAFFDDKILKSRLKMGLFWEYVGNDTDLAGIGVFLM